MNDNPTNSQIDAAVFKQASVCANDHTWMLRYEMKPMGMDQYNCILCNEMVCIPHGTKPPQAKDIEVPHFTTDPRLFWPLAEELRDKDHDVDITLFRGDRVKYRIMRQSLKPVYESMDKWATFGDEIGNTICQAWLKMKGVKINE